MKSLKKQMDAYEAMREELEADHFREWVVFYDEELIGTYPSSSDAAEDARIKFGRGPYLIKQVARLPAFVPMVWRVETKDAVD